MSDYMACPVCERNDWEAFAERDFVKSDIEKIESFHKNVYRFMFDVWFPGQTEIHFQNLFCRNCGLISFFPRPTIDDLDRLRRRTDDPSEGCHFNTNLDIARRRSRYLFDYLRSHHPLSDTCRVLDYGGCDGNLMQTFLEAGMKCSLIDYCTVTMPGIQRLGDTVYDLGDKDRFDLIICNHVIEHVAAPRETLEQLLNHLSDTGILFVEVPMELWKYPPLLKQTNPVTHINFFSPNSLRNLFTQAGASVLRCELAESLHTSEDWNPAIRCIGQKRPADAGQPDLCKPDGMDFLNPGVTTYLRYYLGNRRKLKAELGKRLKGDRG